MKFPFLGIRIDDISKEELLKQYSLDIDQNKKTLTVTSNLDTLRLCYKDKEVREAYNLGTYSTIDGVPLLWIAKWLKLKNLKTKISGSDLGIDVLKLLNEKKGKLFLFGGKEGVAIKAKEKINEQYPNINVVGTSTPEFGYEKNEELCKQYIEEINASKPDVVFLCTGCPKTEKFFAKHYDLFTNAAYFTIGATIDFIAGSVKRAPKWMSKIGLEWLYRLTKDFRRLFKRYWLDGWFLIKIWFVTHFNKKKVDRLNDELSS